MKKLKILYLIGFDIINQYNKVPCYLQGQDFNNLRRKYKKIGEVNSPILTNLMKGNECKHSDI